MTSDGMAEVMRSLRSAHGDDRAQVGARMLGVEGVAVSVFPQPAASAPEPLWCFPGLSLRFEELQFTVGEGPGPDAVRAGVPVLEPDLRRVRHDRWPALLPAAQELGVHGVCCFPLALGGVRLGTLTLLCDGARGLSARQLTDTDMLVAALNSVLLTERGPPLPDGTEPAGGDEPLWPVEGLHRAVVHQAAGMVSVQLASTMEEALVRLRAFAYGSDRPLGDVAEDVVARRMRFGHDEDNGYGPYSPGNGEG
ncbi:GAF and ANTAR domain-containing protein [Streptomyces sp. NPDC001904]|uniref:GAF and ANTAR domain-containing protein n=1 Tax=Streptomyces sp. NPDC001904 TaxID=3154531 RepID=UPI0033289953